MKNNRLETVVQAVVDNVRDAVREHNVTFEEYRAAIGYIMKTVEAKELPLLIDVFLNATMCEVINQNSASGASPADMEGPYFVPDVPKVDAIGGQIQVMDSYEDDEPMEIRGHVLDLDGNPVPDATVFIWSSTPDGKYSGIHEGIPAGYYRCQLQTGDDGRFVVNSTVPVPYTIPDNGPVGGLLVSMGRHTWRPAHVHYKVCKDGYRELITQSYFADCPYVNNDCCEGIVPEEFVMPVKIEDGKRIVEITIKIEPAVAMAAE